MANVNAIHSVGDSLVTYLTNVYPASLKAAHDCTFSLISSVEMNTAAEDGHNRLTLYLYRVTMNDQLRSSRRLNGMPGGGVPLSIDLHYLLTVWADHALDEQVILAWAMRQLYLHPVMDQSSLSPEADWGPGDVVQLIPAELSNEDVMRIWDALQPPYHLSVSYIARVVRIDPDVEPDTVPVVATDFVYTDRETQP